MKKVVMSRWLMGCLLAGMLGVGCGQPKIDASTPEKSKASIEKVRASLSEEEQEAFDSALLVVSFGSLGDNLFEMMANADSAEEKMMAALHGKTGREVMEEARRIEARREEEARKEAEEEEQRRRAQALVEIEELKQKSDAAAEARAALEKFEVRKSRFYKQAQRFGSDQPIIELTVYNGTDHAISRAYFEGTLSSPGRSVPWHKDTFNYSIAGGLEPGEEASWSLAPNMFSDWGRVEMRPDMVFTVKVIRVDGADGEPLFDGRIDEYDEERLKALLEEYGVE